MADYKFQHIIFQIIGQIGVIKFNRPKALNSFIDELTLDIVYALRILNEHPETVFTVITGEGRFFSAGADVKGIDKVSEMKYSNVAEKKLIWTRRFSAYGEMMRQVIDHRKVVVLALNGPAVGGGAAWFQGLSDIVFAAKGAWLQVPFSELALVPENGSALNFAQSMGVHRANEFLMFGRKMTVEELENWGLINKIFPAEGFHDSVIGFLQEQLSRNDGKSMMEAKRLMNAPLRGPRLLAVIDSVDALAERFVEDAPKKRFEAKKKELEEKHKNKSKI